MHQPKHKFYIEFYHKIIQRSCEYTRSFATHDSYFYRFRNDKKIRKDFLTTHMQTFICAFFAWAAQMSIIGWTRALYITWIGRPTPEMRELWDTRKCDLRKGDKYTNPFPSMCESFWYSHSDVSSCHDLQYLFAFQSKRVNRLSGSWSDESSIKWSNQSFDCKRNFIECYRISSFSHSITMRHRNGYSAAIQM